MKLIVSAAVIICTMCRAAVFAEATIMSKSIQAGSLHQGPQDMVAYWALPDDGRYELNATSRAHTNDAAPVRIVTRLVEGNDVSFAMPGHRDHLYSFARRDGPVTASVGLSRDVVALY